MIRIILLALAVISCGSSGDDCRESVTIVSEDGLRSNKCESGQKMTIEKLSDSSLKMTCSCPARDRK